MAKTTSKKGQPAAGKASANRPAAAAKAATAAAAATTPQGLVRLLEDDGTVQKGRDPNLPKDTLLFLYEQMVQVREFDRRMLMLQRQGRIGFYGPILGQEAATVGSVAALEKHDWIFPALREGAAAMMRGLSLTEAINQLIGNGADRCKGRQMPCHYTFKKALLRHVVGDRHAAEPRRRCSDGGAHPRRRRRRARLPRRRRHQRQRLPLRHELRRGLPEPCVLFCQNNQWRSRCRSASSPRPRRWRRRASLRHAVRARRRQRRAGGLLGDQGAWRARAPARARPSSKRSPTGASATAAATIRRATATRPR